MIRGGTRPTLRPRRRLVLTVIEPLPITPDDLDAARATVVSLFSREGRSTR